MRARSIARTGAHGVGTTCGLLLASCAVLLTACGAPSKAAPLPAGPPPEYEAPRPFDAGGIDELAPAAPLTPPPAAPTTAPPP